MTVTIGIIISTLLMIIVTIITTIAWTTLFWPTRVCFGLNQGCIGSLKAPSRPIRVDRAC